MHESCTYLAGFWAAILNAKKILKSERFKGDPNEIGASTEWLLSARRLLFFKQNKLTSKKCIRAAEHRCMQNADQQSTNDERNRSEIEHERCDHGEEAGEEDAKTNQLLGTVEPLANSADFDGWPEWIASVLKHFGRKNFFVRFGAMKFKVWTTTIVRMLHQTDGIGCPPEASLTWQLKDRVSCGGETWTVTIMAGKRALL